MHNCFFSEDCSVSGWIAGIVFPCIIATIATIACTILCYIVINKSNNKKKQPIQLTKQSSTVSTDNSSSHTPRYVEIHALPTTVSTDNSSPLTPQYVDNLDSELPRAGTCELKEGEAKGEDSDDKSAASYSSQTTRQDSGKDDDPSIENKGAVGTTFEPGEVDDVNGDREEPSAPPPTAPAQRFKRSISLFEGSPPSSVLTSYKKGVFARRLPNIDDNSEESEELLTSSWKQ